MMTMTKLNRILLHRRQFAALIGLIGGFLPTLALAVTVALTAPTNNQVFTAPGSVTLSATTTGTGIAKVEFYRGATLVATDTTSPYSTTWSSVAAGSYSITAQAKNSSGTVLATSSAVSITVNAPPTVSVTAPTASQVLPAGVPMTLTATAADSDGSISKVDFYRGGTTLIGTATTAPYSITWGSPTAASYSITAKATDDKNAVTTSSAIAISVLNRPTVALTVPAANQIFGAPANVTLTATATAGTGSGSTITKVDFYQGTSQGTALVGTATASPYTVSWSSVPVGSYALTAVATDSRGFTTTSAARTITVESPPTVAVTSPTADQVLPAGTSVTLTATAADSDGTVTKVDFYRGTTLIGSATTAPYTVTWTSPTAASYSITAKATDNNNIATTSTAVPVTVVNPPTVSLTVPAANQVYTAPANVTITATAASGSGSGATISKVDFYQGTTLLGTATAAPYTIAWNGVAAGNYSLTAAVTDSLGLVKTSAARAIIVDVAPTISLTAPTASQVFPAGSPITLTATASDSDGSISKVDFYRGGTTLIGTATTAPYSISWANPTAASYSITAKATDNNNVAKTSAAVAIMVYNPPTVSLTAPTANQSYGSPATVTVTATAAAGTGSGATLSKVDFYQGTTLIGTKTSSPYTITWSSVPAGAYSLTAVATDSRSFTKTSTAVPILVNNAPTVSITSPTLNQVLTSGATVILTATAADSDGSIAQVAFYQGGTTLVGTATTAPYSVSWVAPAPGSFFLTAKATDNLGAVTTSSAIAVTTTAVASVYYIQPDQLGTPRLITNEQNQVVWRNLPTTEPFGNTPPEDDPNATGNHFRFNLRFPGQYADQETNTNYNYFRDYNPQTGGYTESDPIGLSGGQVSTYAYVSGESLSRTDPEGLYSCIYSVTQHYIVCTPDDPTHPTFASSNYVAGNNDQTDASGAPCQDNPNCSNVENVGPLPSGSYKVGPQKAGSSRRPLTPVFPKDTYGDNRPGGYQTHGCGDPDTCSDGCIAATTNAARDKLNQIFNLEKHNTISVQGF